MRILHTADTHLRAAGDRRWQALEYLIEVGRAHKIELLVISGDLFDRDTDAPNLKWPLRDLFRKQSFPLAILRGNHDAGALVDGDYYGDNVTVFGRPEQFIDIGGVRLFGLPFQKIPGEKVLEQLFWVRQHVREDACNILLYHGELLDLFYGRHAFGDEGERSYMPIRLSYLDNLGVDYVLAGHFHSNFETRRYAGGVFVYSGSPVSITRKETGVRKANLFDTGGEPTEIELETDYFDDVNVTFNPFDGKDPIESIRRRIEGCPENARLVLEVNGLVDLSALGVTEADLSKQIGALMTPKVESLSERWHDVGVVLGNDLYKRFAERLDSRPFSPEVKEEIRQLVLVSMMEATHAA